MRRGSRLGFAVVLMLIAHGCSPEGKGPQQSSTASAVQAGARESAPDLPGECVASESGGPLTCGNLLPADFEKLRGDELEPIARKLEWLGRNSRSAISVVNRQSKERCRGNPPKTLDVLIKAPIAMDSFPRTGTNKRQLVISLFDVRREQGCEEYLYDTRKERGNSRRTIEFTTAWADPGSPPDGTKRTIGEWQTWTLTMKVNGPRKYELSFLRRGQWKQCGHTHDTRVGDVAFISCEAADNLALIAKGQNSRDSSFTTLLAGVLTRDSVLLSRTQADPFTDPAWGRCGSLGCCASEGTLAAAPATPAKIPD